MPDHRSLNLRDGIHNESLGEYLARAGTKKLKIHATGVYVY